MHDTHMMCFAKELYDFQSHELMRDIINFQLEVRHAYIFIVSIVMIYYLLLGSTSSGPTEVVRRFVLKHICTYAIFADFAHVGLKYKVCFLRSFFVNSKSKYCRVSQGLYACTCHPEIRYQSLLIYRGIVYCSYCIFSLPDLGINFRYYENFFLNIPSHNSSQVWV